MARFRLRSRGAKQNPWLILFGLVLLGAVLERPVEALALFVLMGVVLFSPMGAPFLAKLKEWIGVEEAAPASDPEPEALAEPAVALERVEEPDSVRV